MTLHVLFGHYKLDFYGPVWWALHRDITKTERTERTCREDYKYSHGKERTKMYPMRILKPYREYDAEERAAYDKAFQDVIDSAKRQGIELPGRADVEDVEAEEKDEESEKDEGAEHEEEEEEEEEEAEEAEKDEHDEDVEMEDVSEGYATAQEDSSLKDYVAEDDDTTQEVEVEGDLQMEDKAMEEEEKAKATASFKRARQAFFDQPKPKVVSKSEFPAKPHAKDSLIAASGARELSKKALSVPAIPARDTTAVAKSVAKVTSTIAARLSPANSFALATPAASTLALPAASSSGDPQKRGRGRPKKQKLETENEPAVTVEETKSGNGRSRKSQDDSDFLSYYVNSGIEEKTRKLKNEKARMKGYVWVEDEDLSDSPPKRVKTSRKPAIQKTAKKPKMQPKIHDDEFATSKKPKIQPKIHDNNVETSKKPESQAPLNFGKLHGPSPRKQPRIQKQVKQAATTTKSLPPAQVVNQPQVIDQPKVDNEKYEAWRRTNLDRLLFGEPYNMLPNQIKVPGKRAPPQDPLTSDERVTNFFFDMFDRELTKRVILSTLKKEPDSDTPGRRLKKIYKTLLDIAKNTSASPLYRLTTVFSSADSPFRNFCLASDSFGQGLKMLHMSDLDYTGVGNQ